MKIHLIMPMGGAGSRFYKDGYQLPKPLIELNGKPFFYWAAQSIKKFNSLIDITFVILQEHKDKFGLDKAIMEFYPDAKIIVLKEMLNGATLTCLEGVTGIQDDAPILFNDCDHAFISSELNTYLSSSDRINFYGGLLTFKSDSPAFSYIKFGQNNLITGTIEKKVVSDRAICGAYLFKDAATFREGCKSYLNRCSYSEYFMSGVYNSLCNDGKTIKDFATDRHISFGIPEEYEQVCNSDLDIGLLNSLCE